MWQRLRAPVASVLAVLLAAAGCGGVGGDDADDDTGVTLTTMGFGTEDEIASVRAGLADQAIAPSSVRSGEGAFDAQQFLSAVASGNPPDLIWLDRQLLGTYAAKGTVIPLDGCIADENIDMSQFREAAVAEVTLDGKIYGIPEFYNNRILMVNNAALARAGKTAADVNTGDRAALSALARQLTRGSGGTLSRIGFDPKIPEFLPLWAKAAGVDIVSADGKTANLDDPKVVEVLAYTVSLITAQGGWARFKSFRDSWDFFGARNEYATDQLVAMPMEDWYLNVLAENSPELDLGIVPFRGLDGRPVDWVTGSAWAIPAKSDHQDLACRWVKTMTTADSWVAAAKARADKRAAEGKPFTGVYTGNRVADEKIFGELVKPTGNTAYDQAIRAVLAAQDSAFTLPTLAAGAEFRTAMQDAVNRVLAGRQTPADALAQAQREAQAALDAAGK
ncbi:extracellular solute-binding protein [Actinomycetes bacterium KLBMP 9797]